MPTIRIATATDEEAIGQLLLRYMEEKAIHVETDVVKVTVRYLLSDNSYQVFIAEDDNESPTGTVTIALLPKTVPGMPEYFLENLYVDPASRDAKIGSQLIEFAKVTCSPAIATSVAVQEMQTTGQWFVDQGFQPCDSGQEAALVEYLASLPLKRGAEGPLQYYVHRLQ